MKRTVSQWRGYALVLATLAFFCIAAASFRAVRAAVFDVSTIYPFPIFSIGAQEALPTGVAFSADGTKMFVVGSHGDDVNEYTLSTAFTITSASFVDATSISGQETFPKGIAFNTDGTKMFIVGADDDEVNEYTLSSGFDASTATFVDAFSVSSQESIPEGIAFNTDGTKMFIVGSNGDDVNEYTLSVGFDVSTASFVDSFSVSSQDGNPTGVTFNSDGTKMYITGSGNDQMHEYALSSGFDVSTASFTTSSPMRGGESGPSDIVFNNNGSKLFAIGQSFDEVHTYTLTTLYDLSTASFPSFDVSSQETDPSGVTFNSDGTKMFVVGYNGDDVNEYTLATAYDVFSATFVDSFSVSSEDTDPMDVVFNSDGTKMFVIGAQNDSVYEYDVSPAYDVSTASSTNTFSIAGQETKPEGLRFNTDGTKMYIIGAGTDEIYEYTLSTGFDISTASFPSISITSQEINPKSVVFNSDGTKMFVIGVSSDNVNEYSLSTAYDVFTATFVDSVSVASQEANPTGLAFNSDGTKMFVIGSTGDDVNEYTLSVGFDVSSTVTFVDSFSISSQEAVPNGVAFSDDGTKMFVVGEGGDDVNEYTLSVGFDVSTASFVDSFSVSAQETEPTGVTFSTSGLKMFVSGNTGNDVNEYTLSSAYDVSTASFVDSFRISTEEEDIESVTFSTSGLKMYIVGLDTDTVYSYNLSTPFDVSTASAFPHFSVFSQEANPGGLAFSTDGTKMFVVGFTGDDVNEYTLSSAFEVATASFVDTFSVASQDTTPRGIAFNPSGSKMYIAGGAEDTIFQYSLSALPVAVFGTPAQTSPNFVTVTSTISDSDNEATTATLEYSTDNSTWFDATIGTVTPSEGAVTTSTGQINGIDTNLDGSVDLTITWNVEADIPNTDDTSVYLRITPNDGDAGLPVDSVAFAVDTGDPTTPGALTVNSTSTTSVILNFGATTTDSNFLEYKIFYKEGPSGVTTSDTAFTSSSDANLASQTFNDAPTTTISGLSVNTQYTANIFVYDSWGNVTSSASEVTFYTLANTPGTPTGTAVSSSSIQSVIDTNGNPSHTLYALHIPSTPMYIGSDGIVTTTPIYQTSTTWDGITSIGLNANTEYAIEVLAKNGDGIITSASASDSVYTLAASAGAPTVAAASTGSFNVTLDENNNPAATTYAVHIYGTSFYVDTDGSLTGSPVYQTTSTWGGTITATGYSVNDNIAFGIIARNGDNINAATSTYTVKYTLANQASAPTIGTPTATTLPITINVNGNPPATTYSLYNATDGNYLAADGSANGSTAVYQTTSTWGSSFAATGLSLNTSYQFTATARNGDNIDAATSTASTATYTLAAEPGVPTVTASSTTSVVLVIDAASNPSATEYALCTTSDGSNCDGGSAYVQSNGTLDTTATWATYTTWGGASGKEVTGLSLNTGYQFLVVARNGDDALSSYSSPNSIVYTLANAAGTPTVAPASTGSFNITLSENSNPATTTYAIHIYGTSFYVDTDGSLTSSPVYQTTSTWGTPLVATGYSVNDNIAFEVIARNGNNITAATTTASAVYTLAATPGSPTLGSETTTTIGITIAENGNPPATTYAIYNNTDSVYLDAAGAATSTAVYQTTSSWSGIAASSLTPNVQYTFSVKAKNGDAVETSFGSTASSYTLPTPAGQPTISSVSTASLSLAFTDNSNVSTTVYSIYNVTDSSVFTTTTATSSISVTSLTPNTSYQFSIVALHAGSGADAATSTASTATSTVPTVPASVSASADSTTQITVSWTANSNPSGTVYELYNVTNSSVVATTTAVSYAVTGLSASTSYTFKVRAQYASDVSQYGEYSDAVAATTESPPPASSSEEESSSSEGGGGAPAAPPAAPAAAGTSEVTVDVPEDEEVDVEVGGEDHKVSAEKNEDGSVDITVQSDPVTVTLAEGEDTSIDTNSDLKADILVQLVQASSPVRVKLTALDHKEFFIANGESQTDTQTVQLRFNSPDATHIAVSNTEDFSGASFVPFVETLVWELTLGNGEKTVYAKLRSATGGEKTVADSIQLIDQEFDESDLDIQINTSGCELEPGKAYKAIFTSSVYYVGVAHNEDGTIDETKACAKRPFASADKFFTYFDSWDDVVVTTQVALDSVPDDVLGFMPQGPKYDPKYGALVKIVSDPKVYLLLGGNKHWITSETVFTALNYSWNWIEDVAESLLTKYTSKGEITYTDHHPNYTLIKYEDDPKVYRLEPNPVDSTKQVKRWIPDEATFISLNFRWDRIVTIGDTEVYETGEPLGDVVETIEEIVAEPVVFASFLEVGAHEAEVLMLQEFLQTNGFFPADIDPNGYFGPATEAAVKAFQQDQGIDPLGYVGPATRAALNAL